MQSIGIKDSHGKMLHIGQRVFDGFYQEFGSVTGSCAIARGTGRNVLIE